MHWFTENPWPLVILLSGAAVCGLILLEKMRFLISGGFALAAIAVWCIESVVVTPGEQLEVELQRMLDAFIAEDLPGIEAQISPTSPQLRQTAQSGLKLVQLHSTFHLKDIQVVVQDDGETAIASLRANGTLTLRRNNMYRHVATRWKTTWKRESGSWRLTDVRRLDVVSGKEIGVLSSG
jgi:ketosteroid isomerase-like protein